MTNITVVTPPDVLHTNEISFLLIYPSTQTKNQLQDVIEKFNMSFVVYLYELDDVNEEVDWLLSSCHSSTFVIFDIDNSPSKIRDLASYIIANTNTYWLTNSGDHYYNKLSINRVYTLDFLEDKIGGYFEKKQKQ